MTRWEQAWADAVLTAFVVEDGQGPELHVRRGEVDFLRALRAMRSRGSKFAAFGLRAAIWMVATAPVWLFGRCAMITTLARAERTELLHRLLTHRSFAVRELTLLLKLTAAMALLGTASVRARSHYDAPLAAAPHVDVQPVPPRLLKVLP